METHFLFVWSVCAATLKIYYNWTHLAIWIVNLQSHHGRALNNQKVILPFLKVFLAFSQPIWSLAVKSI